MPKTGSNEPSDTQETDVVSDAFEGVLQTLTTFRSQITALQQQVRLLEKTVKKESKLLKKEAAKNRSKGNHKPSGFAKPTPISDDLCAFMGKQMGTEVARTEVTKHVINYISENGLQHSENKKIIKPDEKLRKLLGVKESDEVTYFNLQKYMNQHFPKKKVVEVSSEA